MTRPARFTVSAAPASFPIPAIPHSRFCLFRGHALIDAGQAFVMPQMRVHPSRPRIADAGAVPSIALGYLGVLELVHGQVFWLPFHRDKPSGAETARHRQIARNVSSVVPGVEFFLD